METERKSLEEKAAETLPYIIDDLNDVINAEGDYEDWSDMEVHERMREWQMSSVLSCERVWKGYHKEDAELDHIIITLATGGPAYGLKIHPTWSSDYDILFWYQDWFTEKHYIRLTGTEQEAFQYLADSELALADH